MPPDAVARISTLSPGLSPTASRIFFGSVTWPFTVIVVMVVIRYYTLHKCNTADPDRQCRLGRPLKSPRVNAFFTGHALFPIRLNSRNVRVKTGGAHALEEDPKLGTSAGDRGVRFVLFGRESCVRGRCRVPAMARRDVAGSASPRCEPGDVRRGDARPRA